MNIVWVVESIGELIAVVLLVVLLEVFRCSPGFIWLVLWAWSSRPLSASWFGSFDEDRLGSPAKIDVRSWRQFVGDIITYFVQRRVRLFCCFARLGMLVWLIYLLGLVRLIYLAMVVLERIWCDRISVHFLAVSSTSALILRRVVLVHMRDRPIVNLGAYDC